METGQRGLKTLNTSPDTARDAARGRFVTQTGWTDAKIEAFPGDASNRRYFRLHRGAQTAILMDAPGGAEAPACPPEADRAQREQLGYNAMARLAGPNTAAFAAISQALTQRGFSAPRIFEADLDSGFLLIEDLGDDLFARIIPHKAHEGALYAQAVETLAAIYRSSFEREPEAFGHRWTIQDYDPVAMQAEIDLFIDWYAPYRGNGAVNDATRAQWHTAWATLFPALDAHAPGLALRDYHAENLLWLPERDGQARTGLIDFQDGLMVHPAYDLVSLIEDARRDVAPDLEAPLKDRFFNAAQLNDREAFEAAYAVLAAQRNAKILGVFVRLMKRDNKPRYEQFMGRVARHFIKDIAHPALSEVQGLVKEIAPQVYEDAQQ